MGESNREDMDSTASYTVDEVSTLRKINLIFRFSYAIPFFLASLCGIVYAIPHGLPLHVGVLIPVTVLVMALLVNFSNDYYDHVSGVDKLVFDQRIKVALEEAMTTDMLKKVYWEGNQFDTGLVSESQGRRIMLALSMIAVVLAVPVMFHSGWPVVALGAIGFFLLFFYTAPPINLGARGMGELAVGISFFMMCFCSFYVATGTFNAGILVFSVMIGLVVALMRLVDSLSSHDAHIAHGEMCLSVRIGKERTVPVIKALVIVAYGLAAVMVAFNVLYVLLFLTVPLLIKAWRVMDERKEYWEVKAIPYFFGFSLFTELMFIAATLAALALGQIGLF